MEKFINNPIFICGHRRSGTTLFSCLLENHPELLVYPGESGFFYGYYPIYESDKYTNQERIEQIINFCIKNVDDVFSSLSKQNQSEISFSLSDFQSLFKQLAMKGDYSSKDMLSSLIYALKETYGYPKNPAYWVEKTTSSEIYAADIMRWYPNAKFIHILRDPRDNWASLKSGWDVRSKDYNDTPERLMHSMIERGKFGFELAIRNQQRFGEARYKVIKYEDLVQDVQRVMSEVCEFIGIAFSSNVIEATVLGKKWHGNNYSSHSFDGPSKYNSGRWRERINDEEAKLLEYHFEDVMKEYGYDLCFTLEERIDAAVNHYKWYNYAQSYSFTSTNSGSTKEILDSK